MGEENIECVKNDIHCMEDEIRTREKYLRELRMKLHYRKVDLDNAEFVRDYNLGKRGPR